MPGTEGSALGIGGRIKRCYPVNRRSNAAAWNWLVRRPFGLVVRDVDCAFKLMRRDLLSSFRFASTGAMISTELLVRCLAAGPWVCRRPRSSCPPRPCVKTHIC